MSKIAFVCTGNTCRSMMAEGIFNYLDRGRELKTAAESFGINAIPNDTPSENAYRACKEIGVDISGKTSRNISDVNLKEYLHFYCMSDTHSRILKDYFSVDAEDITTLNISDPYGGDIEVYRQCREQIYEEVKKIVEAFEQESYT